MSYEQNNNFTEKSQHNPHMLTAMGIPNEDSKFTIYECEKFSEENELLEELIAEINHEFKIHKQNSLKKSLNLEKNGSNSRIPNSEPMIGRKTAGNNKNE